jgi:hypothetical protein
LLVSIVAKSHPGAVSGALTVIVLKCW